MTTPEEYAARGLIRDRTDVDAAADLAATPELVPIADGEVGRLVLPPGWTSTEVDARRRLPRPDRPTGTIGVLTAEAFAAEVARRRLSGPLPVVYADANAMTLAAVLNDDEADTPGWRDYRVELDLRTTLEWRHWTNRDGELMGQEKFAEHIEDGLAELVSPPAALMMELAQSIHGTTTARMKSANRLHDGRVQFVYEEDATAGAGIDGTMSIPETIELGLSPFVGAARYRVTARFRYRLRPEVRLGYKLDRPADVARTAFGDFLSAIEAALAGEAVFVAGPPPAKSAIV